MPDYAVVDASLVVKWFVREDDADLAGRLLQQWERDETSVVAPHLLLFEVTNILHRKWVTGDLDRELALAALEDLAAFDILLHHDHLLHRRALEIADLLGQGAAYDSHYLALAELYDCDLWTADARFQRAATSITDRVHLLRQQA